MKRQSRRTPSRRGTTLIEVLAGLVILATLLVSVAMARGRFMRQWAEAERRIQITRSTDRLLADWLSGPSQAVPLAGEGMLDSPANCVWRTRVIHDPAAASVGALVVRFEVFDRRSQSSTAPTMAPPIDLLLHDASRGSGRQRIAASPARSRP